MRTFACLSLTLLVAAQGRAAPPEKPWLELTDPGYDLWELRPLDRRVYVLTLEGTWKRRSSHALTKFFDASGKRIPLAPGTTWVELLPDTVPVEISR